MAGKLAVVASAISPNFKPVFIGVLPGMHDVAHSPLNLKAWQ
jgi:hypothetical protein